MRLVKIDAKLSSSALKDKLSQAMVVATVQAAKVLGIHCSAKKVDSQAALQWLDRHRLRLRAGRSTCRHPDARLAGQLAGSDRTHRAVASRLVLLKNQLIRRAIDAARPRGRRCDERSKARASGAAPGRLHAVSFPRGGLRDAAVPSHHENADARPVPIQPQRAVLDPARGGLGCVRRLAVLRRAAVREALQLRARHRRLGDRRLRAVGAAALHLSRACGTGACGNRPAHA